MRPRDAAVGSAAVSASTIDLLSRGRGRLQTPPGPGPRSLRTSPCPHCSRAVDRSLLFCPHCGLRTGFAPETPAFCSACGAKVQVEDATFCATCGAALRGGSDAPGTASDTRPRAVTPLVRLGDGRPRLTLLDDDGGPVRVIPLDREEVVVGRTMGDVQFDDDAISAEHAVLTWRDNALRVRDLGSANGSWLYVSCPHRLGDGDVMLVGSQVIRFRALQPPGAGGGHDERLRAGSRLPPADNAMLEQLRDDGSVRDVLYLSPGRTILIGREHGDWVFPYDPTMSARHAEIRALGEPGGYSVRDVGSRNGVAVLVRGERAVASGERLLFGRQMLRVDLA
jgi:pSer/pThr/pTyr-binding forkhead associated (FHA) protein